MPVDEARKREISIAVPARAAWVALQVLAGTVGLALAASLGGAGIFAAPLSLPLLWLVGRRHGVLASRVFVAVVATITGAEAGWFLGYVAGGYTDRFGFPPALLGAVVTAAVFFVTRAGRHAG